MKLSESGIQRNIDGTLLVADRSSNLVHKFDARGSHLATIDPTHNVNILTFQYDENRRLRSIVDLNGLESAINRGQNARIDSITSPYGETTTISHNGRNEVSAISLSGNRELSFKYNSSGLLSSITDAMGNESIYRYNSEGRLISDENAKGYRKNLSRNDDVEHNEVVLTTRNGNQSRYISKARSDGGIEREQV